MKRQDEELTVITRAKELCGYILTVTDQSPKKFRFTLVSRLQNYSLDILEKLYLANSVVIKEGTPAEDCQKRRNYQREAYTTLRLLAYIAMVARENQCILNRQHTVMAFAMNRLTGFMRDLHRKNGGEGYILKCDVRKYFDSIDHAVLKKMVDDMELCDRTKWLLNLIIDSYHEQEGKGLPMGNQTSQWFALYYLNGIDRLVKEQLRIRYYTRYMDDMILIHPDKEVLTQCLAQMRDYAESVLHLEFNQKTQIHSVEQGVDYLGFHFYLTPTGKVLRLLRQQNKKKFKRKLRAFRRLYRNGEIDSTQIGKSLVSYRGHLQHGHTYHLRKQIWSELVLRRGTSAPYTQDGEHV